MNTVSNTPRRHGHLHNNTQHTEDLQALIDEHVSDIQQLKWKKLLK